MAVRLFWRRHALASLLFLLLLAAAPFALYAWNSGWNGMRGVPTQPRLFSPESPFANLMIFGHMVSGALITILAPLQLWAWPRRVVPRLHRASGYAAWAAAVVTGVLGLLSILKTGTIGGIWMDAGFAGYGLLLIWAAFNTVQNARAKNFDAHRRWALRLFVLAIGSWIYRVHYHIWYIATGGIASNETFSGAFDLVQNVAFYLPYLMLLEAWFLVEQRRAQSFRSTQTSR
ncbi:MAG: DUF2306 domain-containing protein [Pseudomonadota bacterium]